MVAFVISANFGFNLSVKVVKVYADENPYKNGEVLVVFFLIPFSTVRVVYDPYVTMYTFLPGPI